MCGLHRALDPETPLPVLWALHRHDRRRGRSVKEPPTVAPVVADFWAAMRRDAADVFADAMDPRHLDHRGDAGCADARRPATAPRFNVTPSLAADGAAAPTGAPALLFFGEELMLSPAPLRIGWHNNGTAEASSNL